MKKIITALVRGRVPVRRIAASAQTNPLVLPVAEASVKVDGAAGATEYAVTAEVGKMKLQMSRDAEPCTRPSR